MAGIPATGSVSMTALKAEFSPGNAAGNSLSGYRGKTIYDSSTNAATTIATTGAISFSQFRGKRALAPPVVTASKPTITQYHLLVDGDPFPEPNTPITLINTGTASWTNLVVRTINNSATTNYNNGGVTIATGGSYVFTIGAATNGSLTIVIDSSNGVYTLVLSNQSGIVTTTTSSGTRNVSVNIGGGQMGVITYSWTATTTLTGLTVTLLRSFSGVSYNTTTTTTTSLTTAYYTSLLAVYSYSIKVEATNPAGTTKVTSDPITYNPPVPSTTTPTIVANTYRILGNGDPFPAAGTTITLINTDTVSWTSLYVAYSTTTTLFTAINSSINIVPGGSYVFTLSSTASIISMNIVLGNDTNTTYIDQIITNTDGIVSYTINIIVGTPVSVNTGTLVGGSLSCSWSSTNTPTSYTVQKYTTTNTVLDQTITTTSTSALFSLTTSASTAFFKVSATNAQATSAFIQSPSSASYNPPGLVATAPSMTLMTPTSATVSWGSATNVSTPFYYISITTDAGDNVYAATTATSAVSKNITATFAVGTYYYVSVSGINGQGYGAARKSTSAFLIPSPPASVTLTITTVKSWKIEWTAPNPNNSSTGFSWALSTSSTNTGTPIATGTALTTGIVSSGTQTTELTGTTVYYAFVYTTRAESKSDYAMSVAVTSPIAPPVATAATPTVSIVSFTQLVNGAAFPSKGALFRLVNINTAGSYPYWFNLVIRYTISGYSYYKTSGEMAGQSVTVQAGNSYPDFSFSESNITELYVRASTPDTYLTSITYTINATSGLITKIDTVNQSTSSPILSVRTGGPTLTYTWSATGTPTGYTVKLYSTGTPATLLNTLTNTTTTSATYTPTLNTTYYTTVIATNAGGDSLVATSLNATYYPPAVVTAAVPQYAGNNSVYYSWTKDNNTSSFTVTLYKTSSSTASSGTAVATVTSGSDNYFAMTSTIGTGYYYITITALNGNSTSSSATSASAGLVTYYTPPGAITTAPFVTSMTTTSVTVTWSAATNATSYAVYIGTVLGGGDVYGINVGNLITKTISPTNPFVPGQYYYFLVYPINYDIYGDAKMNTNAYIIPVAPTVSVAVSKSAQTITASWSSVPGTTSYTVSDGFTTTTTSDTSKAFTLSNAGEKHLVTVTATNSVATGAASGTTGISYFAAKKDDSYLWTTPSGVSSAFIALAGGGGSTTSAVMGFNGGAGGFVSGTFDFSSATNWYIAAATGAGIYGAGGWAGGGTGGAHMFGGYYGGGGGGASLLYSIGFGGVPTTAVCVGGGGGASSGGSGGDSGGGGQNTEFGATGTYMLGGGGGGGYKGGSSGNGGTSYIAKLTGSTSNSSGGGSGGKYVSNFGIVAGGDGYGFITWGTTKATLS